MRFKRVTLAQKLTGDASLVRLLSSLAMRASADTYPLRNVAACVVEDGKANFAGLGADEHAEFEIASITKTFNAELLEQAITKGLVDTDTTVGDVLGQRVRGNALADVTLAELANHTSGLPRTGKQRLRNIARALLGLNPDVGVTSEDVIEQALSATLRERGVEKYSNLGHDLLGFLLARVSTTTYPTLIKEWVLDPLGMTETYVALPGTVGPDRPRGVSALGLPVQAWEMDGTAPSGGLRSTTSDMAKYAMHILERRSTRFTWANIKGTELYWHNGATRGFSSMLLLDLSTQRASFVTTDSYADIEWIAFELIGLHDPAREK